MNPNSHNHSPNTPQSSSWDTLKDVPYTPESLAKDPLQRKAEVAIYLSGKNPEQSSGIEQLQLEDVYRYVVNGDQGKLMSAEKSFTAQFDTPLSQNFENIPTVFNSITGKQERKILGYFGGTGFNTPDDNRFDSLQTFLQKYPTPIDVIPSMNHLLTLLADQNGPGKAKEYAQAFDIFATKVYGERYQYHKAFDELRQDAANFATKHSWLQIFPDESQQSAQLLFTNQQPPSSIPLENSQYLIASAAPQSNPQAEIAAIRERDRAAQEAKNSQWQADIAAGKLKLGDMQFTSEGGFIRAYEPAASPADAERAKHRILQKDKIVNVLTTGQNIAQVDKVASWRSVENVYDRINRGQLTSVDESRFLQTIATPMQVPGGSYEKTFNSLGSKHDRGILAFASGRGFNNRDQVDVSDLQTVINRYPTPVEFQQTADNLIDRLRRSPANSAEKIATYQRDLQAFADKVYGKRQEYHEAWQQLEREARNFQEAQAKATESDDYRATELYPAPTPTESPSQTSSPETSPRVELHPDRTKKGFFGKWFGQK